MPELDLQGGFLALRPSVFWSCLGATRLVERRLRSHK